MALLYVDQAVFASSFLFPGGDRGAFVLPERDVSKAQTGQETEADTLCGWPLFSESGLYEKRAAGAVESGNL